MTISDKGELATANDGSAMAWKEVKVTDRDNDSNYSFDEALVAVHETYNTAEGYVALPLTGDDVNFIKQNGLQIWLNNITITKIELRQ